MSEPAEPAPVVVCGLGRLGERVVAFLRQGGRPVVVLDDRAADGDPRLQGARLVRGDCRSAAALEAAGVRAARGVLILTSDDLLNVAAALAVRRINPDVRIVIRMFNQGLLDRLGDAIPNVSALSVSALTAPILALTAATDDGLAAFAPDGRATQVVEAEVRDGGELAGRRLTDLAGERRLLILAHTPVGEAPIRLHEIDGRAALRPGDRVVLAGDPARLDALLAADRGETIAGARWAGRAVRSARMVLRAARQVDAPLVVATLAVLLTFAGSMGVLHYALDQSWPAAFNETVGILVSGDDQLGDSRPGWVHWFAGGMRLMGTVLVAGFTAILTNYLVRARLGDAFEIGRIPESGHVVVCGLGNLGFRCVEELRRLGRSAVVVDADRDNPFAPTLKRMGVPVIRGDATVPQTLAQANASAAQAVIAAAGSELVNLEIALLVRQLAPDRRAVARLTHPDFAAGLREAAGVRHAVAAADAAAPAFATALFGDRVLALFPAAGELMAAVELRIRPPGPASLDGRTIPASMVDYNFVPVALAGEEPFAASGIPRDRRLRAGDRFSVVVPLADLERLSRREPPPAVWSVAVEAVPAVARPALVPLVRSARNCPQAEAEELLASDGFVLAEGLTRGDAEELAARLARERAGVSVRRRG